MHDHAQLIFIALVEAGFHRVDQAGLELLTSGDPPASASQSAGITGVSHGVWPKYGLVRSFHSCGLQDEEGLMIWEQICRMTFFPVAWCRA